MSTITPRSRQKSDRRSQLLAAAEQLMADRGYLAVRLEDIGAPAPARSGPVAMLCDFHAAACYDERNCRGYVKGVGTAAPSAARSCACPAAASSAKACRVRCASAS